MRKKKKKKHPKEFIKAQEIRNVRFWTKIEKCPYVSTILECNVGGDGHIGCLHPSFHENCEVKLRFDNSAKARRKL